MSHGTIQATRKRSLSDDTGEGLAEKQVLFPTCFLVSDLVMLQGRQRSNMTDCLSSSLAKKVFDLSFEVSFENLYSNG
jgi:hypothetical protein